MHEVDAELEQSWSVGEIALKRRFCKSSPDDLIDLEVLIKKALIWKADGMLCFCFPPYGVG